jgi:hypothetical protein
MSDTPPIKPAIVAEVKPRTLDFSLSESKWARLVRRLPSVEQLGAFLRTLVWVAPLTLLIWVYAEREQTVTVPAPPFPIEVKTAAPNRLVKLRGPADGNLVAEFSGPRAKIDKVKELLLPKPDGAAIQIFIDPQLSEGPQELLAVSQLNNHPIFKNNGITVKSCQPPYLKVDIDSFESKEVEVVIEDPRVGAMLSEKAVFSPPYVKVRAPAQTFEDARYNNKLYLTALVNYDQLKNRTGTVVLDNVPLQWQNYKDHIDLALPTVKATLTLKQADVSYTIPALSIRQNLPPKLDKTYEAEYVDSIPNVEVLGPPDVIEAIKKEPGKHVIVSLMVDRNAQPGVEQREQKLKIELPQGVRLTDDTLKVANNWLYTLVKRQQKCASAARRAPLRVAAKGVLSCGGGVGRIQSTRHG